MVLNTILGGNACTSSLCARMGGLIQLIAYGAQDIYLQPRYEKYFKIRVAKFMYHEYLTPEFCLTFN
jgi:hypothetical protein